MVENLKQQLESKELLIESLQQNDLIGKDVREELQKFEKSSLKNQELQEKLNLKEDIILSMQNQIDSLNSEKDMSESCAIEKVGRWIVS